MSGPQGADTANSPLPVHPANRLGAADRLPHPRPHALTELKTIERGRCPWPRNCLDAVDYQVTAFGQRRVYLSAARIDEFVIIECLHANGTSLDPCGHPETMISWIRAGEELAPLSECPADAWCIYSSLHIRMGTYENNCCFERKRGHRQDNPGN